MTDQDNKSVDEMTPEEQHAYNVLQIWLVFLDNLFCIFFVACITFLAWKMDKWALMWFYLLPVFAYTAV